MCLTKESSVRDDRALHFLVRESLNNPPTASLVIFKACCSDFIVLDDNFIVLH